MASVLGAVLLAECAARLLLDVPRYHDAPLELDPELGFRGIPGHVHEVEDELGRFAFRRPFFPGLYWGRGWPVASWPWPVNGGPMPSTTLF